MEDEIILENKKEIPEEIRGWNWGAFLLSWIWGIGNKVYISLLSLIPIFGIIMIIYLGIKGNELAWKKNKWKSIEEFKHVQKKWTKASVVIILIYILGLIIFLK